MFDLEIIPANAMCFIPMNFSNADCIIWQANCSNTLQFPPAPPAIHPLKTIKFTNRMPNRDGSDIRDFADNFDFRLLHGDIVFFRLILLKSPPNLGSRSHLKETFHRFQ